MSSVNLPYGKKSIPLQIPDKNLLAIIAQPNNSTEISPEKAILMSLNNPIASPKLEEIVALKNPQSVVIVVNDITRPTPYKHILPPIIDILSNSGIEDNQIVFVIATGVHRPNTAAENDLTLTENITGRFRVVNHDPDNNLTYVGRLCDGQRLMVNSIVAGADLLITTGLINLHYFAGYSGGRKSILPGVVARELITYNHSRMNEPGSRSGSVTKNPVHSTMLEAARLVNVDFMVNVVMNDHKEIVKVVSGDIEQAWLQGVRECKNLSTFQISQKADVVIASAGGYPKDINVYQAQKALEHAAQAVKCGGTVILCAACTEGYGEQTFQEWMNKASCWKDIITRFKQKFALGGHKAFALARVLQDKHVILISDLPDELVINLFMQPAKTIKDALNIIRKLYTEAYLCYIMPNAGSILPIQEGYNE